MNIIKSMCLESLRVLEPPVRTADADAPLRDPFSDISKYLCSEDCSDRGLCAAGRC